MEVVIKLSSAEEGAILQRLVESMPRYEIEPLERYLTIDEACRVAHVSKSFFYNEIKNQLEVIKLGNKLLVDSSDLIRFLNENKE